jgi:hypothetical protein
MNWIKFVRIFLLVLIIIGIGLLITQKMWVPKVVNMVLKIETKDKQVSVVSNIKNNPANLTPINFEIQIRAAVEKAVLQDKYRNLEIVKGIRLISVKVMGNTITLNFNEDFFGTNQEYMTHNEEGGAPYETTLIEIDKSLGPIFDEIKKQGQYPELIFELQENGVERDGTVI